MKNIVIGATDKTIRLGGMFQICTEDVYRAMLEACGCSDYEAYSVSRKVVEAPSVEALKMRASRDKNSIEGIQQCVDFLKSSRIKADTSFLERDSQSKSGKKSKKGSKIGVYSKSDALTTVNELIVKGGLTDKEKLTAIDLLNKLQQWSKEENKEEKELIHFYLPITCKRCNLYVKELEEKKSEQTSKKE